MKPNFTATQNNRNNVRFTGDNVKNSELNGSKYCLNVLFLPSQDHVPSHILSEFNIS